MLVLAHVCRLGKSVSGYVRPVPAPMSDEPTIGVAHDFYIGGHGLLIEQPHTAFEVTAWMLEYYCQDYNRNSALTVVELF